jgi:hypothetical protein
MTETAGEQLVFRDSAAVLRIVGLIFAAASLIFFLVKIPLAGVAFVAGGVGVLLLTSDLIITADRPTRTLRLEYRYLLFHTTRKIAFDDIDAIRVEKSSSTSRGHTSTGFRLAAVLKDGKKVTFRTSYTGNAGKTQEASRLNTFINHVDRKPALRRAKSETPSPAAENRD